jgi:hypothetical protein
LYPPLGVIGSHANALQLIEPATRRGADREARGSDVNVK